MFKKLFCKHNYIKTENSYVQLGYRKYTKCGKTKYFYDDSEFTYFNLGEFRIK